MRCGDVDKITRGYYLGLLPEYREMPLVPGHQIVGTRRIRAFQELVVVRVRRYVQRTRGFDGIGMAADELEQLLL